MYLCLSLQTDLLLFLFKQLLLQSLQSLLLKCHHLNIHFLLSLLKLLLLLHFFLLHFFLLLLNRLSELIHIINLQRLECLFLLLLFLFEQKCLLLLLFSSVFLFDLLEHLLLEVLIVVHLVTQFDLLFFGGGFLFCAFFLIVWGFYVLDKHG